MIRQTIFKRILRRCAVSATLGIITTVLPLAGWISTASASAGFGHWNQSGTYGSLGYTNSCEPFYGQCYGVMVHWYFWEHNGSSTASGERVACVGAGSTRTVDQGWYIDASHYRTLEASWVEDYEDNPCYAGR